MSSFKEPQVISFKVYFESCLHAHIWLHCSTDSQDDQSVFTPNFSNISSERYKDWSILSQGKGSMTIGCSYGGCIQLSGTNVGIFERGALPTITFSALIENTNKKQHLSMIHSNYNKLNGMSKTRSITPTSCEHDYCPHLHFQRCRKNRQSQIAYTDLPIKQIDLTGNQHQKTLSQLRVSNIPTLAVQGYLANPVLPDQQDTNFSKNFYLENCPQNFQLRNTMVKDLQQSLQTNNAYVLAIGARVQYQNFAKQRQDYLKNAQKRAGIAFQQFYENQKTERETFREEQKRWITEYYRRIQELINHIFAIDSSQNDDPNLKDKIFLKEQQGNNPKKLATIKVRDPQTALGILQSLRAVLLVKKLDLEQVRKDQQHNKSVSASQVDASNTSQNTSQNASAASFISAASNATNQQNGEQHFAEKYCNFEDLKKKWGKASVQQVRKILRMMICRDNINKAEGFQMREKKRALEKDQFLRKQMQKMLNKSGKVEKGEKDTKSSKTKRVGKKNKAEPAQSHKEEKTQIKRGFSSQPLSKQEEKVKQVLLKGGIFDSLGNIYQRNRNYSQLFKKRAQRSLCELSFHQPLDQKGLLQTNVITLR